MKYRCIKAFPGYNIGEIFQKIILQNMCGSMIIMGNLNYVKSADQLRHPMVRLDGFNGH